MPLQENKQNLYQQSETKQTRSQMRQQLIDKDVFLFCFFATGLSVYLFVPVARLKGQSEDKSGSGSVCVCVCVRV